MTKRLPRTELEASGQENGINQTGWRRAVRKSLKVLSTMRLSWVVLVAMVAICHNPIAANEHWNQFRGSQGNGRNDEATLPVKFDDERNVLWKVPIHGKGWSSPVIWEDQIWLTTAPEDGTELYAVCVNLENGKVEHNLLVFEVPDPEPCHPTNSYASCTPFVEEGRIYVHFGTYGTACLDTSTGETLWDRRDLHCDHFRGPAASPIVHDKVLFLSFDGIDVQFVIALDKRTGKTLWRRDRNIDYGTNVGDFKKAYSTPAVIQVGEQTQVVSPSAVETIAYEVSSGEPVWRIHHGGMNAAARPLFESEMVFLSAGKGDKRLIAFHPEGTGDISSSAIAWERSKGVPSRSSLLFIEGRLFMINDDGVASCLNAMTGEKVWTKRLGGAYWASPIYADGLIYFSSKEGTVAVIEAGPKFVLRAENEFPSGFNSSPAIVDNTLILRSFTDLYRIGLPSSTKPNPPR